MSGLLAIVISPQLLEPYYPKPADVVGNSLLALFLYATTAKQLVGVGWRVLAIALTVALAVGVMALVLGAGRRSGTLAGLGRFATVVSRVASARVIYSSVFWLSLVEFRSVGSTDFWVLGCTWLVLMSAGMINWQAAWATAVGGPGPCIAGGMLGPSVLLVQAPALPSPGTPVTIRAGAITAEGMVLNRIARDGDIWGEVHIPDPVQCESLLQKQYLTLDTKAGPASSIVGAVDAASTDTRLEFFATRPLQTGHVVEVKTGEVRVLYQLRYAEVQRSTVKGGAHLIVRGFAAQLGALDTATQKLTRHRWVPAPGAAVCLPPAAAGAVAAVPPTWFRLGVLSGTDLMIYMDTGVACEGHVAILGMTKMGKTSLAIRLATFLGADRRVTILDQTGEYVGKRGLPAYTGPADDGGPGVHVFEPLVGSNLADQALARLRHLIELGQAEYEQGTPASRVLILDEAHQFIPEPALLGFNAPGRESAIQFGQLMMQVRKYGITIILISQRTAVVGKSAVSQCENVIAFKSVDQTGLDYLEAVLGGESRKALPTLGQGQAIVFGPAMTCEAPAVINVLH